MPLRPGRLDVLATLLLVGCIVGGAVVARGQACTAPANVVFLVDTSGSMANVVWHPGFDPFAPPACSSHTQTLMLLSDDVQSRCGTTRSYRVDPQLEARGIRTRFDPGYLNWLHSLPDGHPFLFEIEAPDSGTLSACLGGGSYAAYRESRMSAAQRFVRDVACRVTEAGDPRLGLARPRIGSDPAGGYLSLPIDDDSPAHAAALELAVADLEPIGWGPLGETLFHTYTYAMSREPTALPVGVDGVTPFPVYASDAAGNPTGSTPPSPVQDGCQNNIVVVLADDAPTRDDFDPGGPESAGFEDFQLLIGNYNPDDASPEAGNEEPGVSPTCTSGCEVALYLDDIAMWMHGEDFRPDLAGSQGFTVHTVAFGLEPFGLELLAKTAEVGGGLLLLPDGAGLLAAEIIAASGQSFPVPALPAPARAIAVLAIAAAGMLAVRYRARSRGSEPPA